MNIAGKMSGRPEPQPAERHQNRTYGRRHGHRLRSNQLRLVRELLPQLRLPDGEAKIDPHQLFGFTPDEIWLEIGFGGGEHLTEQAARNPHIGLIGFEPYMNGVAQALKQVEDGGLTNIRLYDGDARDMLPRFPDGAFSRIFLLFPDPWPKKRHHKRRFVNSQTVAEFARLLRPGGELRIASDIAAYVRWTLRHVLTSKHFAWTARQAGDWRVRPSDWPETRYEQKARREGRVPAYLSFRKQGDENIPC